MSGTIQVHTDIPYAELLDSEDEDGADFVTVEELLDGIGKGIGDADEFFGRMRSAEKRRKSSGFFDSDPLGITKATHQLQAHYVKAFGKGRVIDTPFDFWAAARLLTTNTWHSRCNEIIAKIASGIDWGLRDIEGLDPAVGPIAEKIRRLFSDPNSSYEEINDLAKKVFTDLGFCGNAWLEIVRDRESREIIEVWHVPAISVRLDAQLRGYWQVGYFGEDDIAPFAVRFFKNFGAEQDRHDETGDVVLSSQVEIEHVATEMIHFSIYHPLGGPYGIPGWLPASLAIRANRAVGEYNADYFEHQTIPNKMIVFKNAIPDERTKKQLADYFQTGLKGRSHKPLVLSVTHNPEDPEELAPDVEVTDLKRGTGGTADGDFLKLGDMTRDEVVAAWGVPPGMLGIQTAGRLGGKGSEEAARTDFKLYTIEPMQTGFERIVRKTIIDGEITDYDEMGTKTTVQAGFGEKKARLKLRDFDLSDQEASLNKAREMRSAVGAGLRTINEARIAMGLPRSSEPMADVLFVSSSAGPVPLAAIDPKKGGPGVAPLAPTTDEEDEGVEELDTSEVDGESDDD